MSESECERGREHGHNDQREGKQEGRQKETEGRQDGHSDQQEGRQDRRQEGRQKARPETEGRQGGHSDQQDQEAGKLEASSLLLEGASKQFQQHSLHQIALGNKCKHLRNVWVLQFIKSVGLAQETFSILTLLRRSQIWSLPLGHPGRAFHQGSASLAEPKAAPLFPPKLLLVLAAQLRWKCQ